MDVSELIIDFEPNSNRKIINNNYRIIRKLGNGQYGKVILAQSKLQNNEDVAIKTINRVDKTRLITKTYFNYTTKIKREIRIMKECNHPNVVNLHQVIDDIRFDKILLVMEYCKFGEIDWKSYNHYYEKYYKREGLTINKVLRDVVNGLEYLHVFKKIIHRDLKPSNLLISHDNTIKISDFGVSLILENNANDEKELGKSMGTPAFFAPELCQFVNNRLSMINHLDNTVKIDSRIDIWSLGVVLYCLIFNTLPFNGFNEYDLFKNIVNEELKFPKISNNSNTTSSDIEELNFLKSLIRRLLTKDSKSRITISEIKNHPFTSFDLDDLERDKFLHANGKIMQKQQQKKSEVSLGTKIKKMFSSKQDGKVLHSGIEELETDDLERVDELIDSYLDDSSSFGSDLEDDVETSSLINSENEIDQKLKPSPLILSHSTFFDDLKQDFVDTSRETISKTPSYNSSPHSPRTPTNGNTVTIGAGSQLSLKSFFSPSKRYFARSKLKTNKENNIPTISSLSSPKRPGNGSITDYKDFFEPPPIFGSGQTQPQALGSDNKSANNSRKNSISSTRSNSLCRITSSNSSLNLNAYLSDDASSLNSPKYQAKVMYRSREEAYDYNKEYQDDTEILNDTLVLKDEPEIATSYKSMVNYLDGLN